MARILKDQEVKLLLAGDKFLAPDTDDRPVWTMIGRAYPDATVGTAAMLFEVSDEYGDNKWLHGSERVDVVRLKKEVPTPDQFDQHMVLGVLKYRAATVHGNEQKFTRSMYDGLHKKLAAGLADNHQVVICKKGFEVWYVWFYDSAITVGDEIDIGSY